MQTLRNSLAILMLSLAANTVTGHHSTANFNFDPQVRETITGTVTYWSFSNPHSFIDVEVTGPEDQVQPYKIFLTSRVVLQRYGWRPSSLNVGDVVEIEGSPDRQDPREMYLQRIKFPDGSQWLRSEVAE